MKQICGQCRKEFENHRRQVFCSRACAVENLGASRRRAKICPQCQKEFWRSHTSAKFCSDECSRASRREKFIPHNCGHCHKEIAAHHNESPSHFNARIYCSTRCAQLGNALRHKAFWSAKRKAAPPEQTGRAETIEEYLARGGKITKCPDGGAWYALYLQRPFVGGMRSRQA